MALAVESDDVRLLHCRLPFPTVPRRKFEKLCQQIDVILAKEGTVLFRRDDLDPDLYYLLSGEINLNGLNQTLETIRADGDTGLFAIAHQTPRKVDAVARTNIRYVRIPQRLFEQALATDLEPDPNTMVDEDKENSSNDWMTQLLKSPVLQKLPPVNLQRLLISFEEIEVEKGETIIRQNDPGDYFYLIKSGQCLLTRRPMPHAKEIKLGFLKSGEMFGEDSLLSGSPRNVSVSALTSATLLRLTHEKFTELIEKFTMEYISVEQMSQLLDIGAKILDVRATEDYKVHHIPGSINFPFFTLRMQLKQIDRSRPVIVVCNDAKLSAAAAFLLVKNRYDALVLKGGLASVPELPKIIPITPVSDQSLPATATDTVDVVQALRQENVELTAHIEQLTRELETLRARTLEQDKKYRILLAKAEKMKAMLQQASSKR